MSPMPSSISEQRVHDLARQHRRGVSHEGQAPDRSHDAGGAARSHVSDADSRLLGQSFPKRFAVACGGSVEEIAAYLPDNYEVISDHAANPDGSRINCVIGGYDYLGWTLDGYVIPRFASGLIPCREHADLNDAETAACAAMN